MSGRENHRRLQNLKQKPGVYVKYPPSYTCMQFYEFEQKIWRIPHLGSAAAAKGETL